MMTDVSWAQARSRRSWHIVARSSRDSFKGICGKLLDRETLRDERPGNEATCENCLRIGGPK